MTPADIAALRGLCERATQPGPWTRRTSARYPTGEFMVVDANGMWVCDVGAAPHDAAFIAAANPAAVAALLDRVEELERERDAAVADALNLHHEGGPARRELRLLKVELERLTTERDALRGEVERLRLAADMLREIPRAALSADKVYREDWEELFTDEDGAALYLDTAVDRVLDRITRKESK